MKKGSVLLMGFFIYQFAAAQAEKKPIYIDGLRKISINKKFGFSDSSGTLIIPAEYDRANNFFEGLCAVQKEGKIGFIDKANHIVIPFMYDGVGPGFRDGYCSVSVNKKHWMIDKSGKQITVHQYDGLIFNGRFGMMILNNKWGYLDLHGKETIPPVYDYILNISEGLIAAKKDDKYGFIDTLNQIKLPFIYDDAGLFINGESIASLGNKYGTIDKSGNPVIPFLYQHLWIDKGSGWWKAQLNGLWGMIDKKGKTMIPFKFDFIEDFDKVNINFALVTDEKGEKKGMIDKKGNLIINIEYQQIYTAKDGYCGVKKNDKLGIIDLRTGKMLIEPKYDGMGNISEGLFRVKKFGPYRAIYGLDDGTFGYVNLNAKEITDIKFEEASDFSEGMAAVKLNSKWGYINNSGAEVIGFKFEFAGDFLHGKARVKLNGAEVYIDKKGNIVE